MKVLRYLGVLLIFVVIVTAGLSLVLPTSQKIERTVVINAPAGVIYQQVSKLEVFSRITIWNMRDSTLIDTLKGKDGTLGSEYSWEGDPNISGQGNIRIASLDPNKKVEHRLEMSYPKKMKGNSIIQLSESGGQTTVTWAVEIATPRPWNIFNLFHSMEEEMGDDFDEGLAILKKMIEPVSSEKPKEVQVNLLNFPETHFAIVKQLVNWEDESQYRLAHWKMLGEALKDSTLETSYLLEYDRDEKNRRSDFAAALEVQENTKSDNSLVQFITIPQSKAVFVDYDGPQSKASDVYPLIRKKLAENNWKQTGPIILKFEGKGIENPRVRIIFLIE